MSANKRKKQFGRKEYLKVHKLVYEYQAGSTEAADQLLKSFVKFFAKYISLLKYGKYDLTHYSTRSFIKLFVEKPKNRKLINPYFKNKITGKEVISSTVNLIVQLFETSSQEDIIQDLNIIFLNMCNNYKDTKPSFHSYINKNFHFYAYRYLEKMSRDPVARGYTYVNKFEDQNNPGNDISDLTSIIPDESQYIECEQTLQELEIHYNLKNTEKTVLVECTDTSIFDDTFFNTNWINGITCSDIFSCLTPFERQILTMWYVEGKTDTEIGDIFGVCRGTINRRRSVAKSKLIKYVKEIGKYSY